MVYNDAALRKNKIKNVSNAWYNYHHRIRPIKSVMMAAIIYLLTYKWHQIKHMCNISRLRSKDAERKRSRTMITMAGNMCARKACHTFEWEPGVELDLALPHSPPPWALRDKLILIVYWDFQSRKSRLGEGLTVQLRARSNCWQSSAAAILSKH